MSQHANIESAKDMVTKKKRGSQSPTVSFWKTILTIEEDIVVLSG